MRQSFVGKVIGTAMTRTVKVRVPRTYTHPVVKKASLPSKFDAS
jgi:ribosomal protein S17